MNTPPVTPTVGIIDTLKNKAESFKHMVSWDQAIHYSLLCRRLIAWFYYALLWFTTDIRINRFSYCYQYCFIYAIGCYRLVNDQ